MKIVVVESLIGLESFIDDSGHVFGTLLLRGKRGWRLCLSSPLEMDDDSMKSYGNLNPLKGVGFDLWVKT